MIALTDLDAMIPAVYLGLGTLGTRWQDELKDHLARCQVLVPLLSPRFFASHQCLVEWRCFERRQQLQRETGTFARSAVVPVVWTPLGRDVLPAPYADLRNACYDLESHYADAGLMGLLLHGRPRVFDRVVYQLARKIVEVVFTARLMPCDPALFDDLLDSLNGARAEEH
ncbi:hypothetical protein [Streptomyces sp. NPDC127197]|uniref:hypothetical protein n=1 Tax=Streptomyces sp. NPDC127197 TaxID=3345388 RepID=UPI003643E398